MDKKVLLNLKELSKLDYDVPHFDSVLEFVSQIKNAKIQGDDKITAVNLADLREDKVSKSLSREAVLQNAPETDGEYFIVPQVVE